MYKLVALLLIAGCSTQESPKALADCYAQCDKSKTINDWTKCRDICNEWLQGWKWAVSLKQEGYPVIGVWSRLELTEKQKEQLRSCITPKDKNPQQNASIPPTQQDKPE